MKHQIIMQKSIGGGVAMDVIEAIKSFLMEHNSATINDLPVINLMLFWDKTSHYSWQSFGQLNSIGNEFQQDIAKMLLEAHAYELAVPIGICQLSFAMKDEKVFLSDEVNTRLWDDDFEVAEVLNGTVPYFMKEAFGYKLEDVHVSASVSMESLVPFIIGRGRIGKVN